MSVFVCMGVGRVVVVSGLCVCGLSVCVCARAHLSVVVWFTR